MENPLISIAIPVYNTSKYLRKCLESVIKQDYPNLEIVVLNNGSTDDSQSIIEEYAQKDIRIKPYRIEHVETIKESRDNCYKRTSGDWIIPLDSDDAIAESYVQEMWSTHLLHSADMVVSQRVSVDKNGTEYDYLPADNFNFKTEYSGSEALRRTIKKWEMSVNGALVTKKNLYNILLSNPNCKIYSDEYDSRVLLRNASKVAFSKARYYYTFNPNSVGKKNNWGRHRFRLNTRLGLLDLCEGEYGIKSGEYQNAVTQSLGISLVAICHRLNNSDLYDEKSKLEISRIVNAILINTKPDSSCIGIINHCAKLVLRLMRCLI